MNGSALGMAEVGRCEGCALGCVLGCDDGDVDGSVDGSVLGIAEGSAYDCLDGWDDGVSLGCEEGKLDGSLKNQGQLCGLTCPSEGASHMHRCRTVDRNSSCCAKHALSEDEKQAPFHHQWSEQRRHSPVPG